MINPENRKQPDATIGLTLDQAEFIVTMLRSERHANEPSPLQARAMWLKRFLGSIGFGSSISQAMRLDVRAERDALAAIHDLRDLSLFAHPFAHRDVAGVEWQAVVTVGDGNLVGIGATPDEAVKDVVDKIKIHKPAPDHAPLLALGAADDTTAQGQAVLSSKAACGCSWLPRGFVDGDWDGHS